MKISIPEHIKSNVIDSWLKGKSRDKIASEYNIGTGSVSNIIEQWQNMIGVFDANNLRKLGLALKNAGITPVQCVDGLRIINIINQLKIDETHLFDFLQKLYNESKRQRLEPTDIAKLVKVINAFPNTNSLNDIPKYINKKQQEKIKLDNDVIYRKHEIKKLDKKIENERKEIQDLNDDFDSGTKEIQDEKKDFLLFKNVKEELKKNSIDIYVLEPLIHVIKIFQDMRFRPLTILSEFSNITEYRNLVENKDRKIQERESYIQDLKTKSDNYETKISSNEPIVQSLQQLENLGFNTFDIKNLEILFSEISKKYGLNKKEIKIRFFSYMDHFYNLLTLEQEILENIDIISILNSEIASKRKVIESQLIIFSILQKLLNSGLNEHDILIAFKIFSTDLCNEMPYGDVTYLERLSKDLTKYPTVRDTLKILNRKIIIKNSYNDKLTLFKSNLENYLFSLVIYIQFYFIILKIQIHIQKYLRNLLIRNFNYLLFFDIIKEHKKAIKPKCIQKRKEQQQQKIPRKKVNKKKNKKKAKNKK